MDKYLKFFKDNNLKPWPSQVKILNFLSNNIDKKFFIIEAPTGNGKSHFALALSQDSRIYIITSSKFLQDQYLSLHKDMVLLKGKANYECGLNKHLNCENGYCFSFPKIKGRCISNNLCPYYNQLNKAINSKIVIMNYDFLLYSVHCGSFNKERYISKNSEKEYYEKIQRDFLVCDEAHLLEGKLINFVEFTLNIKDISKKYKIDLIKYEFNEKNVLNNLTKIHTVIENRCNKLQSLIDEILLKYDNEIFKIFHNNFELSDDDKKSINKLHKMYYDLDKINQKLNLFFINRKTNKWIMKLNSKDEIFLSPYKASGLFNTYLEDVAKKFVLMSATICDSNEFIKEFGFNKEETVSKAFPSEFDSSLSPILFSPIGKINHSSIDNMLPIIASSVNKVINELHPNEKGIIHTTNYKIADYIFNNIDTNRFIYGKERDNNISNETMFNLHKISKEPTILLSPSLTEGVSLDDDLSRFQIIVKMPFLSFENYRTQVKMKNDNDWYVFKMWINFMQAAGRSTRSKDDYSVTYVFDSNFKYFYNLMKSKLPDWFKERIVI
jgi:Rad3-related DNA helicase